MPIIQRHGPDAEVAARRDCDAVVNVQGDEPLIAPEVIDAVAGALSEAEMTTAATLVNNISDYSDPNVVKVVVSAAGRALYFSRRTIPFVRDLAEESPEQQLQAFPFLKHLGIYGYRCEALRRLVEFPFPAGASRAVGAIGRWRTAYEIAVARWNTRPSESMCRKMCSVWRRCWVDEIYFFDRRRSKFPRQGLTAASSVLLLEARGLKVTLQKFDPYLNVDPGTMSPFQHGEVYVLDDGAETDLDLGHYERFTHSELTQFNNLTAAACTRLCWRRNGAAIISAKPCR